MVSVIGPGGNVVGMRPEMDPTTGMPVFEVKSTNLNDTTVIVSPDSRGLSVSGWRDINVGQRFDYTLSKKIPIRTFGQLFQQTTLRFQRQHFGRQPHVEQQQALDLRNIRRIQYQSVDGTLSQ